MTKSSKNNLTGRRTRISRRDFLRTSAIVGAGLLTACGPAATQPSTGQQTGAEAKITEAPAVAKPVTVTYWYWADNPDWGELFRKKVDEFNQSQNSIRVEAEAQPNTSATKEKLVQTAAAGGGGPDVTYANTSWQQEFYDAGLSLPVGEFFDQWDEKDDIFAELVETHKIKPGQPLLYMPWGIQVDMHYYRSDFYDQAGLKPPDTFEQLVENSKALTNPPDRYGFGLRGADQFGFLLNFVNYMLNAGLTFTDGKGGSDLDTPAGVEMATRIAQLYWDGVAQPSALQDRFPQMVAQLQAGKLAQWGASINHSVLIVGADNKYDDVTGVTMWPKGEGHDRFVNMASAGNMIMKATKNPEAAWEFITWLMEPDMVETYCKFLAFAPPRKSVASRTYFQENRFQHLAVESAPHWGLYPYWHPKWVEFHQTTGVQLWQRVLQKEIPVEEMMKQLADLMRAV
ncbi:MAG TPA: hypothetical protein DEP84_35780 [Chloroflexi bacterium]|nr:hypothetical protein [Chloroflexota bacterium]